MTSRAEGNHPFAPTISPVYDGLLFPMAEPAATGRAIAVLEGELNINELRADPVRDNIQRLTLRRFPKRNPRIFRALAHEYDGIGFTQLGGRIRRRSQTEQIQFTKKCATLGLRVLPPLSDEVGYVTNLFLKNAEKLDEFLPHASPDQAARVTHDIFMDLFKAHRSGIIYGDRWAENILVVPKVGIVNIDFDIEISGRFAREFEASQIAAYILGGTGDHIILQLSRLLTAPYANLKTNILEKFLRGHEKYYDADKKYGPIEHKINTLAALMSVSNIGRT